MSIICLQQKDINVKLLILAHLTLYFLTKLKGKSNNI